MKKFTLLLAAVFFGVVTVKAAQPKVDAKLKKTIAEIRAIFAATNAGLTSCRQVKKDLPEQSAEGGEVVGYYSGGELKKITATFYGETGKAQNEYYFSGGSLRFVFRAETRYDSPGGNAVSIDENRYYFDAGRLIHWIGPEKKAISDAAPDFKTAQTSLLDDSKRYIALLKQSD